MVFNKNTVLKLLLFNGILLMIMVAVFSNAFLKVRIGDSALESAVGITVIFLSIALFVYVNMRILWAPARKMDPKMGMDKLNDLESCHAAIDRMGYSGTFSGRLEQIQGQTEKMRKKQELIRDILLQKFSDTEMSYQRFKGIVDQAENVMCLNIKSILNRINAFDEDEYKDLVRGKSKLNANIASQKMDIYRQYIDFVDKAVEDNEEIMLRLDRLLLEISKLNSIDAGQLDNMEAMKELDSLINETKWYR